MLADHIIELTLSSYKIPGTLQNPPFERRKKRSLLLLLKLAATGTKKIDLKGKTVVPGFNDAHDHLGWFAPVGKNFYHSFSIPGPDKKEILDTLAGY
jgi:hypothetical protein